MTQKTQRTTTYKVWKIRRLIDALDAGLLKLPQYQRRGDWGSDRQKELIRSIRKDWPIGSFLLANHAKDNQTGFLLIDGQQRATAIKRFVANPCDFLDADDITDGLLRTCLANIPPIYQHQQSFETDERIRQGINDWLSACDSDRPEDGFVATKLAEQIARNLEVTPDLALAKQAETIISDLARNWSIADRSLFIIVYGGDLDLLPDIFAKINTAGQRLSKFDIYSATWYGDGTETLIINKKIRQAIVASYTKQLDDGMVFDKPFEKRPPMLVEYLFGLSKLLTTRFQLLFGDTSDDHHTDEVAFNIAATAHQLPITMKSMTELNSVMRTVATKNNQIDPSVFESALIDACDTAEGMLKHILGIRLNRSKQSAPPEILHNTSQIISMVCRVLAGKYTTDFRRVRPTWPKEEKLLKRILPQCYLEDVLEGNWSGAAGNTLWDRVWTREKKGLEPSPYYTQARGKGHWELILDAYHEKLKTQRRTKARYIQKHHKVFLKFAVNRLLRANQHLGETFEIEHLYPVSLLERKIKDSGGRWSIDHVANLALFTKKLNRDKSSKTLAEYVKSLGSDKAERLENEGFNMLMCKPERVSLGPKKRLTQSEYEDFLDERYKEMKKEVLACLLR